MNQRNLNREEHVAEVSHNSIDKELHHNHANETLQIHLRQIYRYGYPCGTSNHKDSKKGEDHEGLCTEMRRGRSMAKQLHYGTYKSYLICP